jgi:hypothetical protein
MAIYSTLVNKAMASKLNSKEFLFSLNLDDGGGKGFSTYNTAPKLNIIEVCISSALVIYTKA